MWVLLALAGLVTLFAAAALTGAPYLPTRGRTAIKALEMLDLKSGQTLLDLGAGTGNVLVLAARRGIKAVGYELNPVLYVIARIRCWRWRHLAVVKLADYWHATWPAVDGIYVFLISRYMAKLDQRISQLPNQPVKVVSYAFKIPGRKAQATSQGLYLYKYR